MRKYDPNVQKNVAQNINQVAASQSVCTCLSILDFEPNISLNIGNNNSL